MTTPSPDPLDNLLASARAAKPETSREEYAFETRLMARLRAERGRGSPWLAFAWKLTPIFACAVLLLAFWTKPFTAAQHIEITAALASQGDDATLARHFDIYH